MCVCVCACGCLSSTVASVIDVCNEKDFWRGLETMYVCLCAHVCM